MPRIALILFIAALLVVACYFLVVKEPKPQLILATTTSTYDSGLLDELLPHFERKYGARIVVVAVGTGQALTLGRNDDVDVLLVHSPVREQEFVDQGYGRLRKKVMYNQFVLVGPRSDPARVAELSPDSEKSAARAFDLIHNRRALFCSRGDDSGTHDREKVIWQLAGYPYDEIAGKEHSDWYLSVGSGMGDTLRMASEKQAYAIADKGTLLSMQSELNLALLLEGDPDLCNQYSVIPVNRGRPGGDGGKLADQFAEWLVTPEAQAMIDAFRVSAEQLFTPNAGK